MDILESPLLMTQKTAKEIIAESKQPLTLEEKSLASTLIMGLGVNLQTVNLDILIKSDFYTLKRCWEHFQKCRSCDGSAACQKSTVSVGDDGKLIFGKVPCDKYKSYLAARNVKKLLDAAGVPLVFRNARAGRDFKVSPGNKQAAICAEKAIDNNRGLYLWGSVRVGKTLLCSIIANERAILGKPSLFLTVPDMLEELKDFDNPQRRKEKLQALYSVDCLIVDDLGAEYQSEWNAAELFRIFDARIKNCKQTIINSNFSLEDIKSRIVGYHGFRIAGRIAEMCDVVHMSR